MNDTSQRHKNFAITSMVVLIASVAGVWLLWAEAAPSAPAEARGPEAARQARTVPESTHASIAPVIERASDGIPIMPHEPSDAAVDGPMHPHAHTPAHERIYRENNLAGQLNGAMDVKDVAGMRRLLQQYRDEYPEDPHRLQEGYEIIADCLEHPGDASRSVGERYWREHKASTLRRYVRRHCLESTP